MFGDLISGLTIESLTDAVGAFLAVPVVTVVPLGVLAILLVEFVLRRLRGLLGVHHAASEAIDVYDEVAAFASYAALKASGYRADDLGSAYQLNEDYFVGKGGEIFLTYSDARESYIPSSFGDLAGDHDEFNPAKNPNWMKARVDANLMGDELYQMLNDDQANELERYSQRRFKQGWKENSRAQDADYDEMVLAAAF